MKNISTVLIVLIATLTISFNSFSQRPNLHQLKKEVLEAQTKKKKVQAMLILGSSFSPRDADITLKYADSVLLMAEVNDSDYYNNASVYLKAVGNYRKGNLILAKKMFLQSYDYFFLQKSETAIKCLNFIGIIHLRSGHPDSAVAVFNQILDQIDTVNVKGRLSAHGNLGKAYRQLGNYNEAIENFQNCINLDSTNQFSVLNSYMDISRIYYDMELYDRAIAVLRQANVSSLPPQPIKSSYFNNLGETFSKKEQYDSAVKYLNKGLRLAKSIRQNQLTLKNRLVLSSIYLKTGQEDSALNILRAVKNDLHYYPVPPILVDFHLKNAEYFLQVKEYDSTIYYAKRALEVARLNHLKRLSKNSYELIAESFEAKKEADSSSFYYKLHAAFLDSLAISEKEKFAQEAKARFKLAQKEKELVEGQFESEKLKLWQKALFALLIIAVTVAFYLFQKFRQSKSEAKEQVSQNTLLSNEIEKNKNEIIELKSRALIPIDDIISIKADGHYLEFNLISKTSPEVDRNQIKSILESLPSKFVQIHRSYIVNIDHIKIKQSTKITLKDGSELPVSRTFKDTLNEAMKLEK